MTSKKKYPEFDATSAGGAMSAGQAREPGLVGVTLADPGTSSALAPPSNAVLRWYPTAADTTAGVSLSGASSSGAAINELRRLSGLTWDQLARLFNVSRRSLHFWASGKPMTPSHEEHLQRLLAVLRKIDRGSANANRAMLLGAGEDGSLPFDLLAAGDYERTLRLLGPGEARRSSPPPLSGAARAARAPRPPEELVGALSDRIHRERGRARAAKSVKVRRDRAD